MMYFTNANEKDIKGMNKFTKIAAVRSGCRLLIFWLLCSFSLATYGQEDIIPRDSVPPNVKDVGDVLKNLFNKKEDTTKIKKQKPVAILPAIGYNQSFGFLIGAKMSIVKQVGPKETTSLSAFGLEAIYTTEGVMIAQARHNVFTAGNKFNWQGHWQLSKFLINDYNIGTGNEDYVTKSDSAFPVKFTYIRLTERVYKKISPHWFAGVGVNFQIRSNIEDEKLDSLGSTPHYRYSKRNGFNPEKYTANSLLLALQYNTREHPIRPYGGTYAEFGFLFNQQWMGSNKNAILLNYDIRKYFSLSNRRPDHVLAFWHLGSYTLSGIQPYLALPATGYDTYNRSGRAYTIGRFKGPAFSYFESEYRFPITSNRLISGVAFVNVQTASDDLDKKLFQYWDPAYGGGLRILFEKGSRSVICVDYAKGKYGSGGFFFGLNEAF